jgi:hypothetical protein
MIDLRNIKHDVSFIDEVGCWCWRTRCRVSNMPLEHLIPVPDAIIPDDVLLDRDRYTVIGNEGVVEAYKKEIKRRKWS